MEVTEALVHAIEMGASDIRATADGCVAELLEKYPNGTSPHLRRLIEEKLQSADLLLGWTARARKELNLPKRP